MGQFLRRYWRWMLTLGLMNLLVWLAFENLHDQALGPRDLWPIRMSLWSGLLLFDNLCVLWWYASQTQDLAQTAKRELGFQVDQYRVANKPIVFVDRDDQADSTSRIIVRNVGSGIAVNVYLLASHCDGRWDVEAVGAVETHGTRFPASHIDARLDDHAGRKSGRVVVAETMHTRTGGLRWVVTLNAQDSGGNVRHALLEDFTESPQTITELVSMCGDRFVAALDKLRQQVERKAIENARDSS